MDHGRHASHGLFSRRPKRQCIHRSAQQDTEVLAAAWFREPQSFCVFLCHSVDVFCNRPRAPRSRVGLATIYFTRVSNVTSAVLSQPRGERFHSECLAPRRKGKEAFRDFTQPGNSSSRFSIPKGSEHSAQALSRSAKVVYRGERGGSQSKWRVLMSTTSAHPRRTLR